MKKLISLLLIFAAFLPVFADKNPVVIIARRERPPVQGGSIGHAPLHLPINVTMAHSN